VGPEAPEPPRGHGKLCLLVSCPGCDPVRGAVDKGMPWEQHHEALGHRLPRACLLVPGPWLASLAKQEPRVRTGDAIDQEPKAQGSPLGPRWKLRSSQAWLDLLVIGHTQACPMGIALNPQVILKGSVRGLLHLGTIGPEA
jgi:hypothetical protein